MVEKLSVTTVGKMGAFSYESSSSQHEGVAARFLAP